MRIQYSILTALLMGLALPGWSQPGETIVKTPITLASFTENSALRWDAVNDGVMGGVSSGGLRLTAQNTGEFFGDLSLENNGGFASVRASVSPGDLSDFQGVELRVRGDGRRYQLRFRTEERFDGVAYRAEFETRPEQWITVLVPFADFRPTFRGRTLVDVPALDCAGIRQMSFMLADKKAGPFLLEIESVKTF